MLRVAITLLLTLAGPAAHADVLDHQHGLLDQLFHQVVGGHHLAFTLLIVVVGILMLGSRYRGRN